MKYIQDPKTGKLIPAHEYRRPSGRFHFVAPDISEYRSMETGEIIGSRSKHREHLIRHSLIEVGNEVRAATTHTPHKLSSEVRKRQIADAINGRGL